MNRLVVNWISRWHRYLPPVLSLAVLVGGIVFMRNKLDYRPSINDDFVLTVDEQRALPADVLPVVLMRNDLYDEKSLPYQVLRLILSKSDQPYRLGYAETTTDHVKSLRNIAYSIKPSSGNPSGLSIVLIDAILSLPSGVTAIDIPADGGLLGLRIPCVNVMHADRFAAVQSIDDLKPYLAVQGLGWGDAKVLAQNGLPTYEVGSDVYLNLLSQGRVDYLPRGILSLEEECGPRASRSDIAQIDIDDHLIITYPNAFVFVVNSQNDKLKHALRHGFERAIADGSHQKLLQNVMLSSWMRRHVRLKDRRLLVLSTPATERLRQQIPDSYWLVPWNTMAPKQGQHTQGSAEILCRESFFAPLC